MNMNKVPCNVCSKLYDGTTHCSVTVCRACAMFFKRCEAWDEIPICKLGNNKCKLKDVGRVSCPACRYLRCIAVGLKRKENVRSLKCFKTESNSIRCLGRKPIQLNIDLPMLVPEVMPTLKRFCYHYAIQSNIRKEYELQLVREGGGELLELPGNRRMALAKPSVRNNIGISCYPEFIKFLTRSFPALGHLDPSIQDTLTLLMVIYFFDLLGTFKTWRIFNDVNTTRIVSSEIMFVDLEKKSSWIGDDAKLDPMDMKAIGNYMDVSWRPILREKLSLMHRINITDVEYLAATALVIWDEDLHGEMTQMSRVAEIHRNMIYKDLDYYYRKILHMDNYIERIMNLKEFIKTSKRTVQDMAESVNFLKTFNYYKDNEEIWLATERVVKVLNEDD